MRTAAALALTCSPELAEAALPKSVLLRFVPAWLPTVDMAAKRSECATEMRGSLQRREAKAPRRCEDEVHCEGRLERIGLVRPQPKVIWAEMATAMR